MPKNDEGEFELVLGNKQLLSVFFIVVVLLGVFFAMGYIAGRNTVSGTKEVATSQPIIVEAGPAAGSQPARAPAVQEPAAKPPVGEEQRPVAPPPKPEPTRETKPVEPPRKPPVAAPPASSEPPAGTYLQVAATTKAEANVLLQVLTKRGFDARLATVPGQDLYRVVVGPVEGAQALAKTRDDLKAAGFKPFTRRF